MIRSAVTVSLVPQAEGGPFVFKDDLPMACRSARDLGFDGIEIFPTGPDVLGFPSLQKLLRDHQLRVAAVGTGAGWLVQRLHLTLPDAADRKKAREFIRSIIDRAGALQAPTIIGSMQGRGGGEVDHETAMLYLAEALDDLGEHAARYGVPLFIEPLNRYESNLVNTIATASKLVDSLSTRNVRILADLFHMNIEEADIPAALRAGGERIGYVHFVDSNRRAAGCGHLDYAIIANALHDIHYGGFLSAEALPHPTPRAAAEQTMTTFRRMFA